MPSRIHLPFSSNSPMSSTFSLDSSSSLGRRFIYTNDPQRPRSSSFRPSSAVAPATLGITIESPPLICYGHPKDSTGALISGLIHLDVHAHSFRVDSFKMVLQAEVYAKRPITSHCSNCSTRTEDIHKWTIITTPVTLQHGTRSYPFSFLFPGNLPATNCNSLGRIRYFLNAVALSMDSRDEITLSREVLVSRAILPGPERNSVRIFPPTNLSAHVEIPHAVHPDGEFQLGFRLDGAVCPDKDTRWKMKKLSWRIEETSKFISVGCAHHQSKVGDRKGILHEDLCTVGSGELKSGWKTDYSNGGRIEMDLTVGILPHQNAACDIDTPCGIKVSHNLVVEMVIAEEHVIPLSLCLFQSFVADSDF